MKAEHSPCQIGGHPELSQSFKELKDQRVQNRVSEAESTMRWENFMFANISLSESTQMGRVDSSRTVPG